MPNIDGTTIVRGLFACAAMAIVVGVIIGAWLLGLLVASILLAVAVFGFSSR